MAALEIQDLTKTYHTEAGGDVSALSNVNLTIQSGEFVVILGPTGCGKTTLLNLVGGFDSPTTGVIQRNADLEIGRNIPCVFQHYTLFPWRTLAGNVAFSMAMRGVRRTARHEKVNHLLKAVGLESCPHAYPHELSGGMRQRAALAQALAADPGMLLLDEPFGALDDGTRRDLQQLLIDVWSESRMTVLFVTHSIDEALILADRIAILGEGGSVVSERRIEAKRPRDRYGDVLTQHFLDLRQHLTLGPAPQGQNGTMTDN